MIPELRSFLGGLQFQGPSCIFASLTVRDVLRRLDQPAEIRSVGLRVRATAFAANLTLHELGVGLPGEKADGPGWDGHLVVVTPDWLIDPTFYAARRKPWDWTPNVAIEPRFKRSPPAVIEFAHHRLPVLAVKCESIPDIENYRFEAVWCSHTRNRGWQSAPDTQPARRRAYIERIIDEYRKYQRDPPGKLERPEITE